MATIPPPVDGADPHERLLTACDARELGSADDRAAVLDWRLEDTSPPSGQHDPLPWLPSIPDRIAADQAPAWAAWPHALLPAELIADVQVWRAATQVAPATCDPRGHPSSATPPESSNSNSTSDSPPRTPTQTGNGGGYSPQQPPAPPRTHSCRNG